jgi:hypothetical protein
MLVGLNENNKVKTDFNLEEIGEEMRAGQEFLKEKIMAKI